jgi:hypothetical protein
MWISPDGRKIIADTLRPFDTWALETAPVFFSNGS